VLCLTFPTVNCLQMPDRDGDPPTVLAPLEHVLRGVAQAGLIHVGVDGFTMAEYVSRGGGPDRLAALLTGCGLECTDVGVLRIGEPTSTIAAARSLAALAQATGARICVTAVDSDPAASGTRALLERCACLLTAVGVRMAVEFLPYTPLATLVQARDLCAAVGWHRCGLLVDAWMFFLGQNAWSDLRALTAEQVAYVQLDDAPEPIGTDLIFESRHRRVLPGQGTFDLARLVQVLEAIRFDGPVSVEVLSDRFRYLDPVDQGRAAAAAARAVWAQLPC
jgi:sugar phosphate isomerase/epimerase